ncbi:penicillin acylase family protein [Pseudalkalibacillus berkeleyi]|uniref:Penicillin acylase family protein n=1 Tax=Pseudalkalibacillus berkeleyi TaxID=1069813 RepID=A0ABS9H4X9_9BACL|nr:penicillin acylase family protein [Pseudalkalibacillus berkeleyi]MCF6139004.1 penicillin acylase family protein [Pseudalkalibacillus berkeleyi]
MEKVIERAYKTSRSNKLRRGFTIGFIIILIFVLILSSVVIYILQRSLPETKGEIVLAGINEPVSVIRDKSGTPHIEANSPRDLYTAQGYVTAQDRLFQMDLSRRLASGQLSEVIGEATLDRDRFFRTLGLRRAAERSLDQYSEEARNVLNWYTDGVNAYIKEAIDKNKLPPEYTILDFEPKKWSPVDSLTIAKYMAFDLGGHWEGQAFRHYLVQNFPEEKALELFPAYPDDGAMIISEAKNNPVNIEESLASAVIPDPFNGSNNWVVSGQKTESGLPILANDPHLGLGTPSIWYETHLKTDRLNVSGVIFAGIPGIIVGHNEQIAWGVTNVGPDVQDLYIEKRNPNKPDQFLYKNEWEEAEIIKEPIKVKDGATVDHQVTITRHGPIISEFARYKEEDTALALKWTALQPSTELEAVLRMNQADDWSSFKEALTYFHTPAQNFVFASVDGDIAYRANGLIPIRSKGDSLLPVPGWTGEYEWEGFVPWEELPTIVNPSKGYIATANNKIVDDDYPYHITHTWAQPYRQERIVEILSGIGPLKTQEMKELQMDKYNLQAEEMVKILLPKMDPLNLSEREQQAYRLVGKWDYIDRKESGAPLLFHLWMYAISDQLFEKQIDPKMMKFFDGRAQVVDELIRGADQGKSSIWMKEAGGITEVATKAFQQAVSEATTLQGKDIEDWRWGKYHSLLFEHPLGSTSPLQLLFNPNEVEVGGSRVTVMAAGWSKKTGKVNHGAAWRTIVDLANIEQSQNIVGPGQSGHVLSTWYDDQVLDWANGTYHTTSINKRDYENGHQLKLVPSN